MSGKTFTIHEKHEIRISSYHDQSINDLIMNDLDSVDWVNTRKTNVMAEMSAWLTQSKPIQIITDWILSELVAYQPVGGLNVQLIECWLARYSVDDFSNQHSHIPYPFSFVYYVHAPEGSAPFYFTSSNQKVIPETGKLILFPGDLVHHVPKNNCHNRVVLAGNFVITPKEYTVVKS